MSSAVHSSDSAASPPPPPTRNSPDQVSTLPVPATLPSVSGQNSDGNAGVNLLVADREAAFLDLDFTTTDRPTLVTQLLDIADQEVGAYHSSRDVSNSPLWHLSVATRLKRLLHLVRDTESLSGLPLRVSCPQTDCRKLLELELTFGDLDTLHDEAADGELLRFPAADSRPLTFRRPTGEDLRRWRSEPDTTAARPESFLLTLLVPNSPVSEPPALPPVEAWAAAFAEFDTLVGFELTTTCPHCGRESTHAVDLETLALTRLQATQQRLFQENHRLAQAYGWSEADILNVPRRRRLRYLAQLEVSS